MINLRSKNCQLKSWIQSFANDWSKRSSIKNSWASMKRTNKNRLKAEGEMVIALSFFYKKNQCSIHCNKWWVLNSGQMIECVPLTHQNILKEKFKFKIIIITSEMLNGQIIFICLHNLIGDVFQFLFVFCFFVIYYFYYYFA